MSHKVLMQVLRPSHLSVAGQIVLQFARMSRCKVSASLPYLVWQLACPPLRRSRPTVAGLGVAEESQGSGRRCFVVKAGQVAVMSPRSMTLRLFRETFKVRLRLMVTYGSVISSWICGRSKVIT